MKIFKLTIILFVLLSCSCYPYIINTMGYDKQLIDLDTAWKNTSSYEYQMDTDNYVKSPIEFEKDGGGDCEDFAIHLIYQLGEKAALIVIQKMSGELHAIVGFNGLYIDAQIYGKYYQYEDLVIIDRYDYAYVMFIATKMGTKSIY